jgi:sterol desaturase/sphingolipid hydroxylase (fatty acid hydroxylase superfamily)
MTSKPHQSIRLFKNPILEALTHVHPSIPFIVWIPAVLYFLVISSTEAALPVGAIALFFALGAAFWTFIEYTMHRYVFHFNATTEAGKYLVFLFHGIHHDDPQDPTRLVMPPVVSIALSIPFYFGFKAALGAEGMPFFSGFISGYLVYDYLHFAIHHFRPKTQWGKNLKEHHMKHHFIAHGAKWGVSSAVWDRVFGTMK